MSHPGFQLARKYGYTMYSSSPNSARYDRGPLSLIVANNGKATLMANIGLVLIQLGPFDFPNPNFPMFEEAIKKVYEGALSATKTNRKSPDTDS